MWAYTVIHLDEQKPKVCCPDCAAGILGALSRKNKQQQKDFITKARAFTTLSPRVCCVDCGETDWNVLQADHINGDGHKHRKKLGKGGRGAGMRTYRWILKNPEEARRTLVLRCANCHQLKTSGLGKIQP
jgi:hypothetical protein